MLLLPKCVGEWELTTGETPAWVGTQQAEVAVGMTGHFSLCHFEELNENNCSCEKLSSLKIDIYYSWGNYKSELRYNVGHSISWIWDTRCFCIKLIISRFSGRGILMCLAFSWNILTISHLEPDKQELKPKADIAKPKSSSTRIGRHRYLMDLDNK